MHNLNEISSIQTMAISMYDINSTTEAVAVSLAFIACVPALSYRCKLQAIHYNALPIVVKKSFRNEKKFWKQKIAFTESPMTELRSSSQVHWHYPHVVLTGM